MATKKTDLRDFDSTVSNNESSELNAITVKTLTNLEEKVEAIDWKLWEIYNIIKNYVETNPNGVQQQVPQPTQILPSMNSKELEKAFGY